MPYANTGDGVRLYSQAETDGAGEILYAASSRGPTVYTAYIATRSKVAAHRDAFVAMTRALAKMQQWLYSHSGKELADVVASFFPHVPHELLVRSLQRYLDLDLWARDPAMSRPGFERLGSSFLTGGLLNRSPVFENCVDEGLAQNLGTATGLEHCRMQSGDAAAGASRLLRDSKN